MSERASGVNHSPLVFDLLTSSAEDTRRLGAALGEAAAPGDLFLLEGAFGSGKTVLAQGLAQGVGVERTVGSPSFVMIARHAGRVPFAHADFFRVDTLNGLLLGELEELLDSGFVVTVEWAERVPKRLRAEATALRLSTVDHTTRQLRVTTGEARHAGAIEAWQVRRQQSEPRSRRSTHLDADGQSR